MFRSMIVIATVLLLLVCTAATADDSAEVPKAQADTKGLADAKGPADTKGLADAKGPADAKGQGDVKAQGDVKMSGMSVLGNEEAPKSLVIVPWKSSQLGDAPGLSRLLDDSTQPVDKEVFMRELAYYQIRSASH